MPYRGLKEVDFSYLVSQITEINIDSESVELFNISFHAKLS